MTLIKEIGNIIIICLFVIIMSITVNFAFGPFFEETSNTIELSCPTANLTCNPASCICPNQPTQYITQKEVTYTSHFQEIITGCAEEREYEPVKWDCDKISIECVGRLQNAGYNCYVRYGKYNKAIKGQKNFENHAWINCGNNLIIEATKGEIIPPSEYWRYV